MNVIAVKNFVNDRDVHYFEDFAYCPHCHFAIQPIPFGFIQNSDKNDGDIALFMCPKCHQTIVAQFDELRHFVRFLNGNPKCPVWPSPILELKDGSTVGTANPEQTKFIETYLQSLEAEGLGLTEISGMGYRKAIEYLIKDWAIYNHPVQKEKIISSWLDYVVKNFYDGELMELIERASWLGNDQTHYSKLFCDYNINDLKELILLITTTIASIYQKQYYIQNIVNRK